jgi:hypothetical protein
MDTLVCQSSLFPKRQNLKEQNVDESEWDSDDDDVFIYEQASTAKMKQTSNAFASLILTVMKNDIRESSYIGNGQQYCPCCFLQVGFNCSLSYNIYYATKGHY